MSEHKATVGGKDFIIGNPSLDKTMRITDYVAEILEQVPGIFNEAEEFRENYKNNHREILTYEDLSNPEYKPVLEALGFTAADFEDESNLITDPETGKTGLPFYKSPGDFEVIAAVFPKVWKAARENLTDLCALLIITDGELEEHDRKGAVNGLITERSRWIRYNATIEELLELIAIGLMVVKEQLEGASNSLGKVSENLTTMLGGSEPEEPTPEEPKSKKKNPKTEKPEEPSED